MSIKHYFLVGAAKAGTSWVDACLRETLEVALPFRKETYFFSKESEGHLENYHDFFPSSVLRVTEKAFESCPTYMTSHECPKKLKKFDPEAKILFLLREPVERAYSHYCMHYRGGAVRKKPEEAIIPGSRLYDDGLYSNYLSRFLEIFPERQVTVTFYDDLKNDPVKFFEDICLWLDIDKYKPSLVDKKVLDRKSVPRFPKIYEVTTKMLRLLLKSREGSWFVRYISRSNFSKIFHAVNSGGEFPPLSAQFSLELRQKYLPMIESLEMMTSRDLSIWKE